MRLLVGNSRILVGILLVSLVGLLPACTRHTVPHPYGYYRIDTPVPSYHDTVYGPYGFELSDHAVLTAHPEPGERYWVDLVYPTLNARIHCSYKSVNGNLNQLTRDALEFIYRHAGQASAIPERAFSHPEEKVYGVFFSLEGNTASPCQFFLTDSVHHFFRAAVYCNCRPNADSLRPVLDYLEKDMQHIVESFHWNR